MNKEIKESKRGYYMEFRIIKEENCDKCGSKVGLLIGLYQELEVTEIYLCKECINEMVDVIKRAERYI